MTTSPRKAEVLFYGGWTDIEFWALRPGDIYRLMEEDGSLVTQTDGDKSTDVLKVVEKPSQLPDGIWAIKDEPIWDFKY